MSLSDLERLLGVRLSLQDIYRYFTKLKCEIEEIRGDTIVFEANSDRPDLFSVEGVARAIRPWLGLPRRYYKLTESSVVGYAEKIPQRPYVALAVVRDLELDEHAINQMMQLQEKIAETYGRRRRKISIGLYDLNLVNPPIYYKLVDPDKTGYKPLNETKEMSLREVLKKTEKGLLYGHIIENMEKYPVLMDSQNKVLSLVPVLNSDDCKVTTKTKNILIDATGTSLTDVVNAVTVMSMNIAERSKTGVIEVVSVYHEDGFLVRAPRAEVEPIEVNLEDVFNLIGSRMPVNYVIELLDKHYYEVLKIEDSKILVKPPVYRIDVKSWVDVAEDIAIAYGYDKLGSEADSLPESRTTGRLHTIEYVSQKLRDVFIGLGFQEVANYMLSSRYVQLELLGSRGKDVFLVENPRTERFECLRVWLAPQLLEVVLENADKYSRLAIFEVGDVAEPSPEAETGARIERRIGFALVYEKATLTDGLAYVKTALRELGIEPVFERGIVEGFLHERTALVKACNEEIGFIGEVNPLVLYKLGLKNPVVIAELSISKIISACL
ncbi:MAG: phenylalanine--tRNA ligase subunit beta [Desulfurococcaceae archaeon]